jgi:hypothetical protein
MLGSSRVAAQLAASQEGLSSMSECLLTVGRYEMIRESTKKKMKRVRKMKYRFTKVAEASVCLYLRSYHEALPVVHILCQARLVNPPSFKCSKKLLVEVTNFLPAAASLYSLCLSL